MPNFCKYCGDPVTEGEVFCDNCGKRIEAPPPPPPKNTVCARCGAESTPSAKFCRSCGAPVAATPTPPPPPPKLLCANCGAELKPGVKFCRDCGTPVTVTAAPAAAPAPARARRTAKKTAAPPPPSAEKPRRAASPARSKATPPPLPKAAPTPPPLPDGKPGAPQPAAAYPLTQRLDAAAAPGEVDCGVIQLPGLAPIQQAAEKGLSPLGGIVSTLGSFLGGVFGIFRSPGAFIGTALMAAIWFVLAQLRESGVGAEIVDPLSWFTFAQGVHARSGAGAVGGLFGMGAVAAMFGTLLSGGMIDAFRGFGSLFTGHGERRSLVSVVIGVVLGGALYFAFAGENVSADTAMAGIAGAVLSLEALGAGDGPLYTLVQSLTSRARNGVRSAVRGRCDGLLTGLALGFASVTALSALGVLEGLP